MYFLRNFLFTGIIISALYPEKNNAQSLNGKVIHVSELQDVMLKFRSVISNFNFTNKDASSSFQTRITNNKNFSINSVGENFKSTGLIIIEGENTHLFILDYKATLDANESLYDFSKKKTLKEEADQLKKTAPKRVDTVTIIKDSTPAVIKNIEKRKPTQKELDDLFSDLVIKANKAYRGNKIDEAKELYMAALEIRTNDVWCVSQLTAIENRKKMEDQKGKDVKIELAYQNHKRIADSAFNKKLYKLAKMEYDEASKIKINDPYARSQLKKIDLEFINDSYTSFMNVGRDAVANQLFDNAKMAFNQALKIKPNDVEAKKELAKINLMRADLFKKGKLDSLNTIKYSSQIAKGQKAMELKHFKAAKSFYQQAQLLKPDEKLPAEKLSQIDVILMQPAIVSDSPKIAPIALQNDINKRFDFYYKRGVTAMKDNKVALAKDFFSKSHQLKPDENLPVEQLEIISRKLEEIKNNDRYETFIHWGDSIAFIAKDYKSSLKWFDSARVIKPNEIYPKKRIVTINQIMLKGDSLLMEKDNEKERTLKYNSVIDIYKKADAARMQRKYQDAYKGFTEFLSNIDSLNLEKYSSSQLYTIKQAKDYTHRLDAYKPNPIADSLRNARIKDSINNIQPSKGRKKKI